MAFVIGVFSLLTGPLERDSTVCKMLVEVSFTMVPKQCLLYLLIHFSPGRFVVRPELVIPSDGVDRDSGGELGP